MEEQKLQKRTKRLYTVMGALLLIIALVSGTYAYFSASVSNTNTIGGNTQNINNNSLTLTVKKVVFNGTSAPSNDLVPAWFGTCDSGDNETYGCTEAVAAVNETPAVPAGIKIIDPSHLKVAQVSSMLTNKCEQDGFTGCHVYQIKINADQNITHANLLLNLSLSNLTGASSIENKNQWGYVVFQADGTVDSSTGATAGLSNPVLNANNGAPAAIGNGVTNLDIHNDSTLSSTVVTYYLLVYLNDTDASQNNVVSNSGDANYAVGSYSGTLELQALGGKVRACFTPTGACEEEPQQTAAQYITSLYTNAQKSIAEVNDITYNLAPIFNNDDDPDSSGGLMNDRHASMEVGIDNGDIRYYGVDPNNYVWLGDTYISTYQIQYNESTITRNNGDKKLWRIIGVFDGKLKLIQNDYIGMFSWDSSERNTTGGNYGYGINQWGPSGSYEGADLMQLLNNESGPYWTKGTGNVYTGTNNKTTRNVSFANTGLSANEKSMIDTATWYLGAYNGDASYVNVQYNAERQDSTLGKICNGGEKCNDEVTRTPTWSGKVGLMYLSDYGYATDLLQCTSALSSYDTTSCKSNDWLRNVSKGQWTMSPHANSSAATGVFHVYSGGIVDYYGVYFDNVVRPVVYLQSSVIISDGDGSIDNPYELSLS